MKWVEKRKMRLVIFQLILAFSCFSAHAQKVSNIRAEQRGQDIVVFYSLEATSPCEVILLISQDNGFTWSAPLKNVFGDVGKNILGGEKQIIWKVLEEQEYLVGDKMKFKVIANVKKSFEPEMVFVEGGVFQMGSSSGSLDEKPIHSVTLSDFNIGKYEVTQAQWKSVIGNNPSHFKGCEDCPVETVSWNDVQDFIRMLNVQTGKNYRLPTEAEWEYAATGGKSGRGYTYSGSNDSSAIAWYSGNSGSKTHTVGGKLANELGVYDMTGNVMEWCSDWYGSYSSFSKINPTGASSGLTLVLRGGGWGDNAYLCRPAYRFGKEQGNRAWDSGFRLVLPVEVKKILVEPEMVFVEGGSFQMGSDLKESLDANPIHTVTLSPFYIGKYEVTQGLWNSVFGLDGQLDSNYCESCPVNEINWKEAQDFISKLNLYTNKNYRLPTEAEWEYAAKGGKYSKGYIYSGSNDLNEVGWFSGNSNNLIYGVGQKKPNELGVFDMSGNVWEWCFDYYESYQAKSEFNPVGSVTLTCENCQHVIRGGSWFRGIQTCGVDYRMRYSADNLRGDAGFRIVLPVE